MGDIYSAPKGAWDPMSNRVSINISPLRGDESPSLRSDYCPIRIAALENKMSPILRPGSR